MAVGRNRRPRRIQEVLDQHNLTYTEVGRRLGLDRQLSTVWDTANGLKNHRKVLRYFLELGVPAEVLDLPRDLQDEVDAQKGKVA
jgi:hypothetical protein